MHTRGLVTSNMEKFFVSVLTQVITSDAVKKMLSELMADAAAEGTAMLNTEMKNVQDKVQSLEDNAIKNLDGMDGKMGNLQEQLEEAPGNIIKGVIDGVVQGISKAPGEILGGLFGQQ